MNNLIKIIFVLSFLLPMCAQGQAVIWSKWYDIAKADNAGEDVKQTFDGGYIILGNYYTSFNAYSFLIKTDYLGNIEWQKVFEDSVTYYDLLSCYAVHQTKDSGYTVSGYGRDSAVLLKTDRNGDVQWLKKYSINGLESRFFDHKNTSDGGIIACGDLYPPYRAFVVKTDFNGNIEWEKNYDNYSTKIIQSYEGSFYYSSSGRISKLNSSGDLLWSIPILNIGSDLIELSPFSLLLAGTNPLMYLSKIDTSGNVLWQRSYFPGAVCISMTLSKDKNVLLSGYKETQGTAYTAVTKIDTSGNEIFTKTIISASGNHFFISKSVSYTNDYGFIITGITDFPGPPFKDNPYVLKTDSLCNTNELVSINNVYSLIPKGFELYQNYPNPFNSSTNIQYEISNSRKVKISIYNVKGEEITTLVNSNQLPGKHQILFNSEKYNISSGIYLIKMTINSNTKSSTEYLNKIIKMLYLK